MLIETNGTRLYVQQETETGVPLLLLHGGKASLAAWDLVVPFFTDRYRVIRLDLRGHGRSDQPADGCTVADMALDVAGVMDHLGIERAHLVGSAIGAEVAASLGAQFPDRLLSLALAGAFFRADFEQINCPVLFLPDQTSAQDPAAQASLTWYRSLLRHSAVVTIPGASVGAVLLEQPEPFARAVRQFHRHVTLLT